jgi:alpha-L-arabinofuranosidase
MLANAREVIVSPLPNKGLSRMRLLRLASLLFFLTPFAAIAQEAATLTIDTAKPVASVSPTLYGIMSEEINYSYDGGLYAELVSNRTFQTNRGLSLEHWTLIQNGYAQANLEIDKTTGPSAAIPHSLKFTVTVANRGAEAGFYNTGFWGMALLPSKSYQGSFYAKADKSGFGGLTIRLVNDNTGNIAASTTVTAIGGSWQKYDFTLKTGDLAPSAANHLEFLALHPRDRLVPTDLTLSADLQQGTERQAH